jgi:predicted transcriptional regulator
VRLEYERDSGWYQHVPESDLERAILEALDSNEEPLNKSALVDLLDEKETRVAKALRQLHQEDRLTRLGAVSGQGGSTGYRYVAKRNDEEGGGLGF